MIINISRFDTERVSHDTKQDLFVIEQHSCTELLKTVLYFTKVDLLRHDYWARIVRIQNYFPAMQTKLDRSQISISRANTAYL